MECVDYDPDKVFRRLKVIEFPITFIGLSSVIEIDLDVELDKTAILKTLCDGQLMNFDEAYNISAYHRAYKIEIISSNKIKITFKPSNECVSKLKRIQNFGNRFVFDLRIINIEGILCCNDQFHAEISRYYISGQFDYCNISHTPEIINFGNIFLDTKCIKYIRVKNESSISASFKYIRVTGCEVTPQNFTIYPKSSKRIMVCLKPSSLKISNSFYFEIRNPRNICLQCDDDASSNNNFLTYNIGFNSKVLCKTAPKKHDIESLHKLHELNPTVTYIGNEINIRKNRKHKAMEFLKLCKSLSVKPSKVEKCCTKKDECRQSLCLDTTKDAKNFCKTLERNVSANDLLNITIQPFTIDFERVGLHTYGEKTVIVDNKTNCDIVMNLLEDSCILYSEQRAKKLELKLKPLSEISIKLFGLGFVEGCYTGTFEYVIDNKFHKKHPYKLQVGNPKLMVLENNLKFGMLTSEMFVISVPIRIYNYFNVPVDYEWQDFSSDVPFTVIPKSGRVSKHNCVICDISYVCKNTKSKNHEIDLISCGNINKIIPIELNIVNRKLSIKFLQNTVVFKDTALNVKTVQQIKLENSSREIALFNVLDQLIPGITIEPMNGILGPKMILIFSITVKVSCVLNFAFEIFVKINNKENIVLPISGNIIEPKLFIHPKIITLPRLPSDMITYTPVTIENLGDSKSDIEVVDTGDDNIFNIYIASGNEKLKVNKFSVEIGQTKVVYIKVYGEYRREYDMYIPFRVNDQIGPPQPNNSSSTDLQYFIGSHEEQYENNTKVKVKHITKEISYCRIYGVITVPWIQISKKSFEIEYFANINNTIEFSITNISKYYLYVTITTSKLAPNFSLDLLETDNLIQINENNLKFELSQQQKASFELMFHPKSHGTFTSEALLYLDKNLITPFYNLTFVGKKQVVSMIPSTYCVIFPPCLVETEITRTIIIKYDSVSTLEKFSYTPRVDSELTVEFLQCEVFNEDACCYTLLTIKLTLYSDKNYSDCIVQNFHHEGGSSCDVNISFCFTHCILTLHSSFFVTPEDNPYPYYPLISHVPLYDYLEQCLCFLEKWLYQQGFHRDLYPIIPETFHAISSALTSQPTVKTKGINVSYLNFIRRMAGPLMKHIRKTELQDYDNPYKNVKEIYDTYKKLITLLRCRGANIWMLQAQFLLSYEQFVIYSENSTPKSNAHIELTNDLLKDENLFNRLNKQCWLDFILQSYKVFVLNSCFFECVCVDSQERDILKIMVEWYNDRIKMMHKKFRNEKAVKVVTNITTDMSDGIALMSALTSYCPFLEMHFESFTEIDEESKLNGIIHNACLIIEAMNTLKLYFPLISTDLIEPNFLMMLFLSIHLYITLPMYIQKDRLKFNPPLLRSSSRLVGFSAISQEIIAFNFVLINNNKNSFSVEKAPSNENSKKLFLTVKYQANFVAKESCTLLIHGFNKTRIFDTYLVFSLLGETGASLPLRKCRITGSIYRPSKVDVLVASPFTVTSNFKIYITDCEPMHPYNFDEFNNTKPKMLLRRITLIDKEVTLTGIPQDSNQDYVEHKIYLQLTCLNTQTENSWLWFRSVVGDFFIKVASLPRWDVALETLSAKVQTWPMDPCSCGEACECYRTTVLMVPHRNDLMVKAMRYATVEYASETMLETFDTLIGTNTGRIVLELLYTESGTNMLEIYHILRNQLSFRVTSRNLLPRIDRVVFHHHTNEVLALPITIPANDKSEKYSITFTSECGMDVRIYKIAFVECQNAE